jgi:hypothetical protein
MAERHGAATDRRPARSDRSVIGGKLTADQAEI